MLVSSARAPRSPDLRAYAANVTRSHGGWLVSLREEVPAERASELAPLVASEPLRRLAFDGEDLIVEFGPGPGRPRRHVITGPLALEPQRRGLELEIRITGARSHPLVVRLEPPTRRSRDRLATSAPA